MTMNKLKFTNYDTLGKPQTVLLKYADGKTEVLDKWPHTMYYDEADKKYRSLKTFTNIKNQTYA